MKKTSIFALASTAVLLISGIFASKAAKRFATITSIYYRNGGSVNIAILGATTDNLVTLTGSNVAFFERNNVAYTLVTAGDHTLFSKF